MASKSRAGARNRGIYESTPFLAALNNPNAGFVETPGGNPYTINDIKASKAQKKTANGPFDAGFTEFGSNGSETPFAQTDNHFGGGTPQPGLVDGTGGSGSGGATDGRIWDSDWAFNNPQAGVLNWLEKMGFYVDDLNPDPFSQYMQQIAAGMPYLYRFSGEPGVTGTAGYGDYLESYMNAMLNTPAGADNYSGSPLYDWNELRGLMQQLATGGSAATADSGPTAALSALKSLPPDQALQALTSMMAAASSTGMTPIDFAVMNDDLNRGWSQYQRQHTTPRAEGSEGTLFWDYLMNSGVLGQLFGF